MLFRLCRREDNNQADRRKNVIIPSPASFMHGLPISAAMMTAIIAGSRVAEINTSRLDLSEKTRRASSHRALHSRLYLKYHDDSTKKSEVTGADMAKRIAIICRVINAIFFYILSRDLQLTNQLKNYLPP